MQRRLFLGLAPIVAAFLVPPRRAAAFGMGDFYSLPDAAAQNDFDGVVQNLQRGDAPDTEGDDNRTALSYAAFNGNMQIADLLLTHGANPDHRDRFGNTALHWAAAAGHADMVHRLIEAKAAINPQNKQGITPMMLAIGNNRPGVVRSLIASGADPSIQDYTGHNAAAWAVGKNAMLDLLKQAATH
jgi:uncharacterized protein